MSFNKIKAMKNAERYLTQGKIQSAISEYKQVVENDPKDINSRNMLGDLYVKAEEKQSAVKCYQEVADYYNSQGFAKKAIAIYNKIFRIEPDSMEVVARLAELYCQRGSMAEAKKHYESMAERYDRTGHKIEALSIWEKIAEISSGDSAIYMKIANAHWQENRKDEAAKAFADAGNRLVEKEEFQSAVQAFSRSLEVHPEDIEALKGFVKAQIALGYPEKGAKPLEKVLKNQPFNKEINYLLMDCYFDIGNLEKAEQLITKLVEREPANYPKLLELVSVYLESDNLDSAVRILAMTSEHLLVGGENEQLYDLLSEVLARNPEHISALRLLARYHGWQRDELELQETLERLAESAQQNGSVEDERYALAQYILLVPHDVDRSNRLKEINNQYGDDGSEVEETLLNTSSDEVPTFESFAVLSDSNDSSSDESVGEFESQIGKEEVLEATEFNEEKSPEDSLQEVDIDTEVVEAVNATVHEKTEESAIEKGFEDELVAETALLDSELSAADEVRIDDEIESIKFYIEQGYSGLAEKSLSQLETDFGKRSALIELRQKLPGSSEDSSETKENLSEVSAEQTEVVDEHFEKEVETAQEETQNLIAEIDSPEDVPRVTSVENEVVETVGEPVQENLVKKQTVPEELDGHFPEDNSADSTLEDIGSLNEEIAEEIEQSIGEKSDNLISFDNLKDELGLDSEETADDSDYEEHYQHAVVYQEMGMLEEAIREFQDAVNLIAANDGTHRYLNCCTLIGHCFMEKEMPNLAIGWFEKAFETKDLQQQEKLGLYYELASAYDKINEKEKAREQFELIYSLDVDFRDVGKRLESLNESVLAPA